MARFSLIAVVLAVFVAAVYASANGFNEAVNWLSSLDEAKKVSAETGKPVMALIHKSWCGACKRLKTQLEGAAAESFVAASADFVMVNLADDAEPADPAYAPDGGYIPRVIFVDAKGAVRPELKNPARSGEYKYFYTDATSLVNGMKAAKAALVV